jgi:hypothetical protein
VLGSYGGLQGKTWNKGPRSSIPKYYSCRWPVFLDYVSFIEEHPLRGESVCQNMASQFEEGHQDEKKMLVHVQQE